MVRPSEVEEAILLACHNAAAVDYLMKRGEAETGRLGRRCLVRINRMTPYNVSILGSCISRDNFNSKFNDDYKKNFSVVFLQNQSALVSAMSSPFDIEDNLLIGVNEWSRKTIIEDARKGIVREIQFGKSNVILIDLFSDARFGVLHCNGGFLTYNDWHLTNAPFFKKLENKVRFRLDSDPILYEERFLESCLKLKSLIDAPGRKISVVLNSARAVPNLIECGVLKPNKFDVGELNERWDRLDKIFVSTIPSAIQIQGLMKNINADSNHPFGAASFHYEPLFYKRFLAEMTSRLIRQG